jgi:hypothetical protein
LKDECIYEYNDLEDTAWKELLMRRRILEDGEFDNFRTVYNENMKIIKEFIIWTIGEEIKIKRKFIFY